MLATNGDNLYSKDMFQTVMDVPGDADVIALDYYSRYQRATGPPCTRFAASEGAAPCKENRLQLISNPQCCAQHRALARCMPFVRVLLWSSSHQTSHIRSFVISCHALPYRQLMPIHCQLEPARLALRYICRMQWCHTDLGAMAFRQQRLLEEDMRFGVEAQDVAGPGPEHADGLLAARVLEKGELCNAHDGMLLRLMSADCCYNLGHWEHTSSTRLM